MRGRLTVGQQPLELFIGVRIPAPQQKMTSITKIQKKLSEVIDPELGIPITDLGLIYNIKEKKGIVKITMTLTTIGCPLYHVFEKEIIDKVSSIPSIKKVEINLVFDPPWSPERMSQKAKIKLGF